MIEKIRSFITKTLPLLDILKNDETYIVGGFIRDVVIGKSDVKDIDIATKNPQGLIKKISKNIRNIVVLDEENQVYRVFLKNLDEFYLDISKLQGDDIIKDLSRRDFTINAVAFCLQNGLLKFIDPFYGIDDTRIKCIRKISTQNIIDDPLRILRAYRFKAELDFNIENETITAISHNASLLSNVASERIKSEIFKILNTERAKETFYELFKQGVLDILFPFIARYKDYYSGARHRYDLLHHSFKMMEIIENYCNKGFPLPVSSDLLLKETEYEAKLSGLIKLAALFHDVGKLSTKNVVGNKVTYYEHEKEGALYIKACLEKMKFSVDTTDFIALLVRYHMYPFYLINVAKNDVKLKPRTYIKLKKYFGDKVVILFNFAISDSYATSEDEDTKKNIELIKKLYNLYLDYEQREKKTVLLNGRDIMKILQIKEGPMVGKVLSALKEASLADIFITKEEAEAFVKNFYEKNLR